MQQTAKTHVAYLIITRFNLFSPTFRSAAGISDEGYIDWCRRRVDLFRTITMPSVLNQTVQRFRWIVLFDTELNEPIADLIDELKANPLTVPLQIDLRGDNYRQLLPRLRDYITKRAIGKFTHVSTTRLDSDDALHEKFLAITRQKTMQFLPRVTPELGVRIIFPYAAVWDGDSAYVGMLPRNQFATYVEELRPNDAITLKTAYFKKHSLQWPEDVDAIFHEPLTLTVLHGQNVANRELRMGMIQVASAQDLLARFSLPTGIQLQRFSGPE